MKAIIDFLIDYIARHKHPLNAVLHIFGVPMAFYGFYKVFFEPAIGTALIFFGYLFQYLGHRAQGNEVGEVTLIKKIWKKLKTKEISEKS
ncbi:MAG: DUF962 domain-containing protein [Candidatus Obscuribacterales bacterium]|nr:DUF962 domain-containing protein [Candidatus Obscuribacterales bacterium]